MFELEEGHRILEKAIRSFAEKEIAPLAEKMDSGEVLPYDLMRKMAEAFGIRRKDRKADEAAPSSGSRGEKQDPMMEAIVAKEICRVSPGYYLSFGASLGLCGRAIMKKGTPEQVKKYGLPVMNFDKIGCFGLTEPDSGSDAFALTTIARPKDDGYILNGSKTFITNAPFADVFVVYARIVREDKDLKDKRKINAFVCERVPGLTTSPPMKKMGMCASPTGAIYLDDVKLGKEHLLGGEEAGSRDSAKEVLFGERSGLSFMAWGIIERCLEESIKYAIQRKQFGKSLAEFQLIQEKIAKMYVLLENVRNMCFKQVWLQKNHKGAPEEYCASKYYASQAAVEASLEAIQIMGGYGFMKEYHVEMLMRDAKLLMIGGGPSEIQLLTIAKELMRKNNFEITLSGDKDRG
jgi:acyl-CoA dehydrogenase